MSLKSTKKCKHPGGFTGIPAVLFFLLCLTSLVYGQTAVTVNPTVQYQTFEGWGVSICWWGNQIGRWSEQNRNALIEYIVNPTTGLGYTLYRFNIGGGENPAHAHMTQFRDMPGYSPSRGVYDWNADSYQRLVLQRILARGKELGQNIIVEAFSNSPPYWMTNSQCASGSSDGGANLPASHYGLFADYLTEVVKHYRDAWGITFRTLEPMNEPSANWWKANGSQEGCHFGAASHSDLINAIGKSLADKGLTGTTVSAPDETSIDVTISSVNGYTSSALACISQINTHSYSGSRRTELKSLAQRLGKRLWQSESGPLSWSGTDNEAAIFMAERIIADIREMKPDAWLDWQVIDGGVWGTIHVNQSAQTYTLPKRFYMHSNFNRFIRPGSVFIDINNSHMIAALDPQKTSLTIVALNSNTSGSSSYSINLSGFATVGSSAEVYRTSYTENLVKLTDTAITHKQLSVSVPASSITTYIIPIAGVSPTPTPTLTSTPSGSNVAAGKTATADSAESANPAGNGNDDLLTTRWCAADAATGHWWKVDLGGLYNLTGSEVYWEFNDVYQYLIEVSTDNSSWQTVADRRNNSQAADRQLDIFSRQARYVRITITGLATDVWASFYEFRVFGSAGSTGLIGDANEDDSVTILDALIIAQFAAGQTPGPFNQTNADVNCDSTVTIIDAMLIAQKVAGIITAFPCTR